ncbi:MAG: hypothetical protein HeimC2_39420 [Candidatus Heimdallarchaeota archaeon LC_2]|nr:MAG: hypothetical protein HeimC2_39420 [Candidatus Heimdallarchaeota archaeon LC_2]
MTESPSEVSIRYEIAKDLVQTKQELIRKEINAILKKWKQESVEILIAKAKNGALEEAEHDAILLTNYLDELKELEHLIP